MTRMHYGNMRDKGRCWVNRGIYTVTSFFHLSLIVLRQGCTWCDQFMFTCVINVSTYHRISADPSNILFTARALSYTPSKFDGIFILCCSTSSLLGPRPMYSIHRFCLDRASTDTSNLFELKPFFHLLYQ